MRREAREEPPRSLPSSGMSRLSPRPDTAARGQTSRRRRAGDVGRMNAERDRLPTVEAARYCGFRSPRGLLSAYRRGKVFPVGRRGGSGSFTWRPEDLDAFLRGEKPMGTAMALRHDADGAPGYLALAGGRFLRSGSGDRPANGPAPSVRARLAGAERDYLGRRPGPGPASTRGSRARRGNDPVAAALGRVRSIVAGGKGR